MRKIILLLFIAYSNLCNGQWLPTGAASTASIYRSGKIGFFGTGFSSLNPEAYIHFKQNSGGHYVTVPELRFEKIHYSTNPTGTYYYKWDIESGASLDFKYRTGSASVAASKFSIDRQALSFTKDFSVSNHIERFEMGTKSSVFAPTLKSSYISFLGGVSGLTNYSMSANGSTENGGVAIEGDKAGNFTVLTKGTTSSSLLSNDEIRFRIDGSGKVIIGKHSTTSPGDYKLYVEKGILTEKVKVAIANTANWADFVFAENYKLKDLSAVEAFIMENKHLPDVPSANEMVSNGMDVAKMNALLLQKIEELTLYVIKQEKRLVNLEKNKSN
ncbi:MAG TPA: hypothetical protein PKN75_03155 [Bacteroidia bacterium]|nr:hypothetical protein [Bacteroidia bacterium]HNU32566.1 hypothetical protein [Bacteroidia bacterium]